MGNYTRYPNPSLSSNPSVGTNGATAPTSSTEVAGKDGSGNLIPVSVDSSGNVNVNVVATVVPTGGATSANQLTEITALGTLNTSVNTLLKPASTLTAVTTVGTITNPVGIAAGSAIIGNVRIDQTTPGTTNGVQVNAALPAGTNAIGKLAANSGVIIGAVEIAAAQTLSTVTTVGAVTAITNALPAGTNGIGKLTANSGVTIGAVEIAATQTLATVTTVGTVTNITNQGQLVDNAAFVDGTTRLNMSGYIYDDVAGTALTENDGAAARIDSKRAQVGVIEDATTRGQRMAVSAAGAASCNSTQINGNTVLAGAGSDGNGAQRVTHSSGPTATLANVASSATTVTILAASTSRLGATITNESTAILYLKFGATASLTSYTVPIAPNGYYELPGPHIYNGILDGIWSAANGNARVTSW